MKRFLIGLLLLASLLCESHAGNMTLLRAGKSGGGGACAEYTTWLAATSGTSALEKSTVQTMICGLVTDGVWTLMDIFYWFPTNTTGTAAINMKTPGSFNIATIGTCTFTADAGWTGDAATCVLNTTYIPSTSGRITLNNASAGVYITIGSAGYFGFGGADAGGNYYFFFNPATAGTGAAGLSTAAPNSLGAANAIGNWVFSRVNSTQMTGMLNGTALGGSPFSQSTSGAVVMDQTFPILANHQGGGTYGTFADFRVISAWAGLGLTGAQQSAISARLNAACVAMGITGGAGTC